MLVLNRKRNESIHVNQPGDPHHVQITIVEIRGDRVKVGVRAGSSTPIYREEVWEQIKEGETPKRDNLKTAETVARVSAKLREKTSRVEE